MIRASFNLVKLSWGISPMTFNLAFNRPNDPLTAWTTIFTITLSNKCSVKIKPNYLYLSTIYSSPSPESYIHIQFIRLAEISETCNGEKMILFLWYQ